VGLVVCIWVPHHRRRISGDDTVGWTNRICVAVVAEGRDRQELGCNIEIGEVPGEGDLFIGGNFEVGCRRLCWLCDRQTTGGGCLGDAVERAISYTSNIVFAARWLT
jgi:hypothetical protein